MTVHFVLPNDIDDPLRPSGGNVYDRRVSDGLTARGWSVREHPVIGDWPHPTEQQRDSVGAVLASLPDLATVVIDGLVASAVPSVLGPQAQRLRLVILVHMPLGDDDERSRPAEASALSAASAVVTTSRWSAARLRTIYDVDSDRLHVALPGVDPAPLARCSLDGTRLLCVAAVAHHKGQDVLLQALAQLQSLPFHCVCAGTLDREPSFVDGLRRWAAEHGLARRVTFVGALPPERLQERYGRADLLVQPSRGETYGMVVTEALAHGVPVVATDAKGQPEALGRAPDGSLPGVLVPPGDAPALAAALEDWLRSPSSRARLRDAARARRATLVPWDQTVSTFGAMLNRITARTPLWTAR